MKKDCWRLWVRYWGIMNFFSMIIIIIASMMLTYLFNEDYSDEEILQNYSNILYGSALKESAIIKFGIIPIKRPDVVAIGSSRVMQFREDYFINKSFYTMGGTARSLIDAQETFNLIKREYAPKVVILGVDLWWLNPRCGHGNSLERLEEQYKQTYRNYKQSLLQFIHNKKMRYHVFHLENMNEYDEYGGKKTVGLTAAVKNEGFRLSDGSYQYGEIIKNNPPNEEKFKDTYDRMEKGNRKFEWTNELDEVEIKKLEKLIIDIKESGSYLIVILPPFPNEIWQSMNRDYNYNIFIHKFEDVVNQLCKKNGVAFFDFSSLLWIDSNDNESIDGFHGSDLAYAKVVRAMMKDCVFCKYVDNSLLNYMIQNAISNVQLVP